MCPTPQGVLGSHIVFHCVLQCLYCVLGSHIVCFRVSHCVFQGLSEDECARLHKKQAKAALRKRREQEQQRLHVAQQIQRQLEEVEVKQREVEKRGVVIERVLRGDGPGQSLDVSS